MKNVLMRTEKRRGLPREGKKERRERGKGKKL
jgi:hypothetical protein